MTDHEPPKSGGAATLDPEETNSNSQDKEAPSGNESVSGTRSGRTYSKLFGTESYAQEDKELNADSSETENAAEDTPERPKTESEKLQAALNAKLGSVLLFGTVLPSLLTLGWTFACYDRMALLMMKHPIETLVEFTALLNVPIANFLITSAVARGDLRYPLRNGMLIGMAAGTSLLLAALCFTAIFLGYPVQDINGDSRAPLFTVIGLVALGASLGSIYIANRLRQMREFRSARKMSLLFSLGGVAAAALMLVGAEARAFIIRAAEYNATSEVKEERDAAVETLNRLDAKRDLRVECSDARAAGLPGMFIKMDPVMQRQVYFLLTGEPFRDAKASNYSAMPDDYLRRHVVGAPVENLSLVRSAMTGTVNGDNLTSTINWTFVVKNRNYTKQEARAELLLPHGAVINGVSQWAGEGSPPRAAHVGLSSQGAGNYMSRDSLSGSDVTDLGRDRVLIRCTNIPAQSETKLNISIASPLSLNDLKFASLTFPKFVDSNFNVMAENSFRLRSKTNLQLEGNKIATSRNAQGDYLIVGNLKGEEMNKASMTVDVTRDNATAESLAAFDPKTRMYFTRSIFESKGEIPNSLMVVIDGSESMKKQLNAVIASLKKIPDSLPTSVLVASSNEQVFGAEPMPLESAIKKLESNKSAFMGGQDNLQTVVKAAGIAGESKNGAVLWIHGPQAGLNGELYITAPYASTPKFFEASIEQGADDGAELFKNHREIGPLTSVTRTNNIAADMSHFLAKWQPGGSGYEIRYNQTEAAQPAQARQMLVGADAKEFISVCLKDECEKLTQQGKSVRAGQLAYLGNIVTPDTSAVISFIKTMPKVTPSPSIQFADNNDMGAQTVVGATNGTIGPQANDATYITGVNTAGTVRVNNLANLEALLNIFGNLCELGGMIGGGALLIYCAVSNKGFSSIPYLKLSRGQLAIFAVTMIVVGLAVPGSINWLVASARDANLFD